MGTKLGRIEQEFMLQAIVDKEIILSMHWGKEEIEGKVVSVGEKELEVEFQNPLPEKPPKEELNVFFSYYGNYITFTSKYIRVEEDRCFLAAPEVLCKNLKRKYIRVHTPEEIEVSFSFADSQFNLNFPKTEEYEPLEVPVVDPRFNATGLDVLVGQFREYAEKICDNHQIIMFRNRSPKTLEELIVSQLGKVLYINTDPNSIESIDAHLDDRIISHSQLVTVIRRKEMMNLDSYLDRKSTEGISSELYCPILFHEYIIGYIFMQNTRNSSFVLNRSAIDLASNFAKILTYSLKNSGYFKDFGISVESFQANIIDISGAGLLFCHKSAVLENKIMLFQDLKLILKIRSRKMIVDGRVMRKYISGNLTFYGIQFMEIKPEDFRFLFDVLYGKQFTEKDNETWEGGAPPPQVDFDS